MCNMTYKVKNTKKKVHKKGIQRINFKENKIGWKVLNEQSLKIDKFGQYQLFSGLI